MTPLLASRFMRALWLMLAAAGAQAQGVADPFNYSRAVSYTYYYDPADGSKDGLLASETVEPDNPQLCVVTTYSYDTYGNKTGATTSNCATGNGRSLFATRTSTSSYAGKASQTITVGGAAVNVNLPAGLLATVETNALNQSTGKGYDPRFGTVADVTDPNGLTAKWEFDDFGRKTKEIHPDGTRTLIWHCVIGAGLDTASNSVIGGVGCSTPAPGEAPADAAMFVHTEQRDAGAGNGSKMAPFVRVYTDRLGREIRSVTESFDGAGQPAARRGALVVRDTVYNDQGIKVIETQPYFLASGSPSTTGSNDQGLTRTDVDVLGRPIAVYVSDPNGSVGSVSFGPYGSRRAALQTMSYAQLAITSTNDQGRSRKEEKNALGQLVRVTDATGGQLVHQHDAFGNLVATKDALQNTIRLVYDARGHKLRLTDPDAGIIDYCVDALGQVKAQQTATMVGAPGACPNTVSSGTTAAAVAGWTTFAYDKLGRLTHRIEPEYQSSWYHDTYFAGAACNKGIGQLCETRTSNGVNRKRVYDSLGRLINQRTDVASGPSFASAVSYDATTGRIAGKTYPSGVQVGYAYTGLGFLDRLLLKPSATLNPLPATVGATPGAGASWAADKLLWQAGVVNAQGKSEQQSYGNGVTGRAVYDAPTARLTTLSAGTGSSTHVLSHGYAWDSLGNLTSRADDNGDGGSGAVTETFAYADGLNRLTSYSVAAPAIPGLVRNVSLHYNVLGMLLYKSDVGNYSYVAQGAGAVRPHAVRSISGATATNYGYDAAGNLVSASAGKYRSLAYTSFNLPDSNAGAQGPGGTPKYSWSYDEEHVRFKEVHLDSSGTRTTWYLHPDNAGGLAFESETAASGAQSHRHYLSAGGDSLGVFVTTGALPTLAATQTAPTPLASTTLVKLEYWHKDHLGSIAATTDHQGAVTERLAYDPFGKRRYANGRYDAFGTLVVDWSERVNHGNDRGFTGHEHLDDIGIVHMNGRLYDPQIGRFLATDPHITHPEVLQNYDRYSYVLNNPLNATDPTGFDPDQGTARRYNFESICNFGCMSVAGVVWAPPMYPVDYMSTSPTPSQTANGGGAARSGGLWSKAWNTFAEFFGGPDLSGHSSAQLRQMCIGGAPKACTQEAKGKGAGMGQALSDLHDPVYLAAKIAGKSDGEAQAISLAAAFINPKSLVKHGAEVLATKIDDAAKDFGKFSVGRYDELVGTVKGLDAHHVGQKALMKDLIPGYDPLTAPSILVPKVGHTIKGPNGIVSRSMDGLTAPRDVLARDIKELRRVYPEVPNSQLQQLIRMNKEAYPGSF